jgi:hypothetical protein
MPLGKFLEQSGLADAGFAAHERDAAGVRIRSAHPLRQLGQTFFALEQVHRGSKPKPVRDLSLLDRSVDR